MEVSKKWHQTATNEAISFIATVAEFFYHPVMIFIGFTGCLILQISHLSAFILRNSLTDSLLIAYLFSFTAEATALNITIHGGSKNTIKNFAMLTFWVNCLYYELWVGFAVTPQYFFSVISKITLSGIIAYCLYSYSELFFKQARKSKDNKIQEKQKQLQAEEERKELERQAAQQLLESEQARETREHEAAQKRLELEEKKDKFIERVDT